MTTEAMLYEKLAGNNVRCHLCAHMCKIAPSKRGICGVRENQGGTLKSLNYGMIIAESVDPIEKKPLFHVYPGSSSFSIATVGCNFRCSFCQNNDISQMPRETGRIIGKKVAPSDIVERAAGAGSKTIAYTYTEPTIFFEYAYDTGKIAHERNIENVFITNGFATVEAIKKISPFLDAANVDLKSFSDDFYNEFCGASLKPVLEAIRTMKELGIWIEITTLIIPTLNDSDEELEKIASFISGLGNEIPWHISRFYPMYKIQHISPTPVSTIHRALKIGKEAGLKYVYAGNVPGDEGESTYCSNCGNLLIERYGYSINKINLSQTACPRCKTPLDGIFQDE